MRKDINFYIDFEQSSVCKEYWRNFHVNPIKYTIGTLVIPCVLIDTKLTNNNVAVDCYCWYHENGFKNPLEKTYMELNINDKVIILDWIIKQLANPKPKYSFLRDWE